ncbi:type II toxin-antitoxin system RatA family toxin [Halonatronum saccharophilum]|uniref:type II toxin-antitoxin system RatA family toxin n=1 Tax=Halonatronum saccharophilum TaxID=150060 RepID=UPI00048793C8|nr:SRPBCC family protein [Halonatronum saccharophilum]
MPCVEESIIVNGSIEGAYKIAKDMESYPKFMKNVVSVQVLERNKNTTVSSWITDIDGRKICWKERDYFNDDEYQIIYKQISGDLKKFDGQWDLKEVNGGTKITLVVDFDFGIPMLAPLLNPILEKKVKKNSRNMLEAIKKQLEDEKLQCS